MPGAMMLTFGLPIDVNQAQAEDLVALPGIGPALAQRIVELRRQSGPYPSLSALKRVRGIGPGKVGAIKGQAVAFP